MYIKSTTITIPAQNIRLFLKELLILGYDTTGGSIDVILQRNFKAGCLIKRETGEAYAIYPDNPDPDGVHNFLELIAPYATGRLIYETGREGDIFEVLRSYLIDNGHVRHQREIRIWVDIPQEEEGNS